VFRKVAVSPAVVLASRPHLTYGKESGMFQKYRLRSTRGSTQGLLAQTRGASSTGAVAVGAFALGALAVGALAIGALAIRKLRVQDVKLGTVEIEHLRVKHMDPMAGPEAPLSPS
jgi:hypothetical protein